MFDSQDFFGEDYLYFHEYQVGDELTEQEMPVIESLLGIEPPMRVLDLGCGTGRVANRLALSGNDVVGVDANGHALGLAVEAAKEYGVHVTYERLDMRSLDEVEGFDRALLWSVTFGYFSDAENLGLLRRVRRSLRPGGRLLLEIRNRDALVGDFRPGRVVERDGDLLVDQCRLDLVTGRMNCIRFLLRDGELSRRPYSVRLYSASELRYWLGDAGFSHIDLHGDNGGPLSLESDKILAVAHV
ncbi:class I SAM-dependent methyltransferase [Streptomyces sulphureus]|uniref:class I SAM-dependent methyltransferase n=1 Tax=Streptomyces sulphureus TaxID=47758 RepID=UPI00036FDA4F|nr:class I SAM-dependent methyltransferase [Streptomyces sulphureus]